MSTPERRYRLIEFDELPGVDCPCGTARRALTDLPELPVTVHRTEITVDAQLHYHRRLSETYYILQCDCDAKVQLDDELLAVRPGMCIFIPPGVRHRAVGRMTVLIIVSPKFDPTDEVLVDDPAAPAATTALRAVPGPIPSGCSSAAGHDFLPAAGWENLRRRAELLRAAREFFRERGFLEVDTPILSADTVVDRHLEPFHIEMPCGPGQPPRRLWLQTSPEFAMKRLLAAGATAIYQLAHAFRLGEVGPLHNPEFTLVEWYRTGDGPSEGMQLTSDLCEATLGRGQAERLSYRYAFERYVGLDPHTCDAAALVARAQELGIAAPASFSPRDRDAWLDLLLTERIQPHLGVDRPLLLYDYPASQAALARIRDDDPPVAERFELYVDGIELANGYHELTDPVELRCRIFEVNAQRRADGKPTLPEQSRLLRAMEAGLPGGVGVALGFDRLVMIATGTKSIGEVIAFPLDRA